MLERCLALRRALGNKLDIAPTLSTLSQALVHTGDAEGAREGEEEAMAIFRELGDRSGEAIGHQHLAQISIYAGDDREARHQLEQALPIAQEIRHRELESECERMLGELTLARGDAAEAFTRISRSLEIANETGNQRGEALALWALGKVDLEAPNIASARVRLRGALRAFRAFEMRAEMLECLEDYAALARQDGVLDDAVRLCGATARARQRNGLVRTPIAERKWLGELAALREGLGERAFAEAWSQGQAREINEAVAHVL